MSTIVEKLSTIKENSEKIYEAGQDKILTDFNQIFWDLFQEKGARADYTSAFSGQMWTDKTFKPLYIINAPNFASTQMFKNSALKCPDFTNKVDFSKMKSALKLFENSTVQYLKTLDFSGVLSGFFGLNSTFSGCRQLVTIEKLIMPPNSGDAHSSSFAQCYNLENIIFEGTNQKSISFEDCPKLSKESILSAINMLDNEVDDKPTITFNKEAIRNAFGSNESLEDFKPEDCAAWQKAIKEKTNWSFQIKSTSKMINEGV